MRTPKILRLDTQEDAQSVIDTIISCNGHKIQTIPLESIWWIDKTLYGYIVFILEDEKHCITQEQVDDLVYIPDGLINTYVDVL